LESAAWRCFCLERYDEAIAAYGNMTIQHAWIQAYLIAACVHAGRRDDADRQWLSIAASTPAFIAGDCEAGALQGRQVPRPADRGLQAVLPASDGMEPRCGPRATGNGHRLAGGEESLLDPAARKLSIAVLPFTNMSGDPDQEYFADGLTEDIITDLSQVSALSVVARHTVFAFKGKTLQVQQVARDLKVDYILEGSVRKSDGQVRVTAQLIDGATGDHRWPIATIAVSTTSSRCRTRYRRASSTS